MESGGTTARARAQAAWRACLREREVSSDARPEALLTRMVSSDGVEGRLTELRHLWRWLFIDDDDGLMASSPVSDGNDDDPDQPGMEAVLTVMGEAVVRELHLNYVRSVREDVPARRNHEDMTVKRISIAEEYGGDVLLQVEKERREGTDLLRLDEPLVGLCLSVWEDDDDLVKQWKRIWDRVNEATMEGNAIALRVFFHAVMLVLVQYDHQHSSTPVGLPDGCAERLITSMNETNEPAVLREWLRFLSTDAFRIITGDGPRRIADHLVALIRHENVVIRDGVISCLHHFLDCGDDSFSELIQAVVQQLGVEEEATLKAHIMEEIRRSDALQNHSHLLIEQYLEIIRSDSHPAVMEEAVAAICLCAHECPQDVLDRALAFIEKRLERSEDRVPTLVDQCLFHFQAIRDSTWEAWPSELRTRLELTSQREELLHNHRHDVLVSLESLVDGVRQCTETLLVRVQILLTKECHWHARELGLLLLGCITQDEREVREPRIRSLLPTIISYLSHPVAQVRVAACNAIRGCCPILKEKAASTVTILIKIALADPRPELLRPTALKALESLVHGGLLSRERSLVTSILRLCTTLALSESTTGLLQLVKLIRACDCYGIVSDWDALLSPMLAYLSSGDPKKIEAASSFFTNLTIMRGLVKSDPANVKRILDAYRSMRATAAADPRLQHEVGYCLDILVNLINQKPSKLLISPSDFMDFLDDTTHPTTSSAVISAGLELLSCVRFSYEQAIAQSEEMSAQYVRIVLAYITLCGTGLCWQSNVHSVLSSDILLARIGEVSTALIEQALRPTLGLRTIDGSTCWIHTLEWLLEPRYADAVDERVRWYCASIAGV